MARPPLWFLDDRLHAQGLEDRRDLRGLMSDNGNNRTRLQRLAGSDDVLDERTTARAVQNFGERRLQARSLARSQNDDGTIR